MSMKTKYIDAEKLIAEIERRIRIKENLAQHPEMSDMKDSLYDIIGTYQSLKSFINSLQQEQPNDLASLISEATNVAKRIVNWDSFYNSLPQNLRNKYTSKAWYEILEALSMMKGQKQQEINLEEEVKHYIKENFTITDEIQKIPEEDRMYGMDKGDMLKIARHFYKLGLNVRKA